MHSTAETCHVMSSNPSLPGSCRTLSSIDSGIIRLVLAIVRNGFDRRLCVSYVGACIFFFYLIILNTRVVHCRLKYSSSFTSYKHLSIAFINSTLAIPSKCVSRWSCLLCLLQALSEVRRIRARPSSISPLTTSSALRVTEPEKGADIKASDSLTVKWTHVE